MSGRTISKQRRRLVGALGLLALTPGVAVAKYLSPTPRQPTGPFYPVELPLDDDNDLTRVSGQPGRAAGQITELTGRLLDTGGNALDGLRIEIWQCDANGRYHHPGDERPGGRDIRFQGHGHTLTDAQGRYRFRTIRPVPYPGRTPHIHTAVFLPGQRPFVTQLYVQDEPGNTEDFLFRRIPEDKRPLVLAEFSPAREGGTAELTAVYDLVLGAVPRQG